MDMTNQEYNKYVEKKMDQSPLVRDMIWAFIVGGLICVVGQGLMNAYQAAGLDQEDAGLAVSMTLVLAAALATGLKVYDDLAKHAGAGTLVPITGFANSIVSPAMEFKTEGFITGMAAKMFTIAGPVLVFGISASVVYGLILVLFGLA